MGGDKDSNVIESLTAKEDSSHDSVSDDADDIDFARGTAISGNDDPAGPCPAEVDDSCSSFLVEEDFSLLAGNEGYGLFQLPMLFDFIHWATLHAAKCRAPLRLKVVNKRQWGRYNSQVGVWEMSTGACVSQLPVG